MRSPRSHSSREDDGRKGFTLIELSIVLVIIGLIVGGVLVGQDLIRAAEVRAQISQIEKYNTAVNTFRVKYGAIPGDMNVATADQFGFAVGAGCGGAQGQRDGNGLLDGYPVFTLCQFGGETALFWQDLSSPTVGGSLVDGQFPNSGAAAFGCETAGSIPVVYSTTVGKFLPAAKIGKGNFVSVYENNGLNWYSVCAVTQSSFAGNGFMFCSTTIPVVQAYNIDKKVDDGLPTTGNVMATYNNNDTVTNAPSAASDTSSTCYNTTTNNYSLTYNSGAGANCALSFMFQ